MVRSKVPKPTITSRSGGTSQLIARLTRFNAFAVYLLDDKTGLLSVAYSVGYPDTVARGLRVKLGEGLVGAAVAEGKPLSVRQEDLEFRGHSIECRINAEDPRTFAPSPGTIKAYHPAGGMHVRVDSGLYAGYKIPPYYDSMIAKLIVYGRTRESCMMRMRRALEEMVVDGVKTNIPLQQRIMADGVRPIDIVSGMTMMVR